MGDGQWGGDERMNFHNTRSRVVRWRNSPKFGSVGMHATTVVAMGFFMAFAACETPPPRGQVVIGVERDAGALLPVIEQGTLDAEVNAVLYLGLNSPRWEDGALEYVVDDMSLAEGWEYSADSLALTYRLRQDAVWSDGQPLTSADVVFTYELIRRPEIASPRIDHWENLDSVVAVDDHTVTFFFNRRYSGMLFHTGVGIIPMHVFQDHATDNATLGGHPTLVEPGGQLVVSGPFQVAEWRRGDRLTLEPNPLATTSPRLERVVFRIIPEESTRLIELENGSVDVIDPMPVGAAEQLEADPRFRVESVTQRYYDYIGWNGARFAAFNDPEVRRALSLAIDRGEILAGLDVAPYAQHAAGPYPPIFSKLVDPTLQPDPYLPDSALAILAAVGWRDSDGDGVLDRDGQAFAFTMLIPSGNQRRSTAAQIVQAQYAGLGIDVEVREVEFNALLDMMFATREFEAVLMGWRVGLEPSYVVGLFWPPDHTFNITGYSNPTVDDLIASAQSAASEDEAAEHWRGVARAIASDRPYAFLWFFDELVGVNERVGNARVNTYGVYQNLHQWSVE